jgi:hypothetical protein
MHQIFSLDRLMATHHDWSCLLIRFADLRRASGRQQAMELLKACAGGDGNLLTRVR